MSEKEEVSVIAVSFTSLRERARNHRWVVYAYCFSVVSLTAGIVYGWPALRQELKRENPEQWSSETALGAAFTAGAWSTQGLRFFTGVARDRYGTAFVATACLFAIAVGSVGVAISESAAMIGVSLFAQGIGSGVQLCVQPVVADLFPTYAGAVLASLSGAFQISGLVYLLLTKLFATRRSGFLVYAALLVLLAVVAVWILPWGLATSSNDATDKPEGQGELEADDDVEDDKVANSKHPTVVLEESELTEGSKQIHTKRSLPNGDSESQQAADGEPGNSGTQQLSSPSAWDHVFSWKFLGLVQWFSLVITPLQYYVGALGFQLEEKGDDSGKYSDMYSILYGCAAVLSPAGGYLADKITLGAAHGMATSLSAVSFFFLASDRIPLKWQSIGLACNATGRMWVFATFFAHVGRRFGYQHFGTLAGLALLTSAIVSLLQYPLLAAAAHGQASASKYCTPRMLALRQNAREKSRGGVVDILRDDAVINYHADFVRLLATRQKEAILHFVNFEMHQSKSTAGRGTAPRPCPFSTPRCSIHSSYKPQTVLRTSHTRLAKRQHCAALPSASSHQRSTATIMRTSSQDATPFPLTRPSSGKETRFPFVGISFPTDLSQSNQRSSASPKRQAARPTKPPATQSPLTKLLQETSLEFWLKPEKHHTEMTPTLTEPNVALLSSHGGIGVSLPGSPKHEATSSLVPSSPLKMLAETMVNRTPRITILSPTLAAYETEAVENTLPPDQACERFAPLLQASTNKAADSKVPGVSTTKTLTPHASMKRTVASVGICSPPT
eukprot:scaffold3642_cov182-Amphora_coffeaeformis.AAC.10